MRTWKLDALTRAGRRGFPIWTPDPEVNAETFKQVRILTATIWARLGAGASGYCLRLDDHFPNLISTNHVAGGSIDSDNYLKTRGKLSTMVSARTACRNQICRHVWTTKMLHKWPAAFTKTCPLSAHNPLKTRGFSSKDCTTEWLVHWLNCVIEPKIWKPENAPTYPPMENPRNVSPQLIILWNPSKQANQWYQHGVRKQSLGD